MAKYWQYTAHRVPMSTLIFGKAEPAHLDLPFFWKTFGKLVATKHENG